MVKSSLLKLVLIVAFTLVVVSVGFAQPGDPSGNPDVPITGIEWLLAAGAALGIKKLWAGRKENN